MQKKIFFCFFNIKIPHPIAPSLYIIIHSTIIWYHWSLIRYILRKCNINMNKKTLCTCLDSYLIFVVSPMDFCSTVNYFEQITTTGTLIVSFWCFFYNNVCVFCEFIFFFAWEIKWKVFLHTINVPMGTYEVFLVQGMFIIIHFCHIRMNVAENCFFFKLGNYLVICWKNLNLDYIAIFFV